MFPIQDWVPSRSVPVVTRALIATYFTFEAPLSGISTNPARALGSALHANYWHALWIYFIANIRAPKGTEGGKQYVTIKKSRLIRLKLS
jgi:major intrinsic protein